MTGNDPGNDVAMGEMREKKKKKKESANRRLHFIVNSNTSQIFSFIFPPVLVTLFNAILR